MRAAKLEKIKTRLEELQTEIRGESVETVQGMQEESTLYPDPNDRASLETEHINNLRIRDRERKLLEKVDEALERVEKKTFGYCDECGNEIDEERLLIRPVTTYCIICKESLEAVEKNE
ncbi:MAG: RNA polymerase-binding protein DksA [SAR324 cluster bacterium]|nr:RNA polymerase-binding protein DksA [SAR324 cluster bacterium]MBL7034295.1 RNA polymerase-binding protein DksA [SAR324 cluster bacterium]